MFKGVDKIAVRGEKVANECLWASYQRFFMLHKWPSGFQSQLLQGKNILMCALSFSQVSA